MVIMKLLQQLVSKCMNNLAILIVLATLYSCSLQRIKEQPSKMLSQEDQVLIAVIDDYLRVVNDTVYIFDSYQMLSGQQDLRNNINGTIQLLFVDTFLFKLAPTDSLQSYFDYFRMLSREQDVVKAVSKDIDSFCGKNVKLVSREDLIQNRCRNQDVGYPSLLHRSKGHQDFSVCYQGNHLFSCLSFQVSIEHDTVNVKDHHASLIETELWVAMDYLKRINFEQSLEQFYEHDLLQIAREFDEAKSRLREEEIPEESKLERALIKARAERDNTRE